MKQFDVTVKMKFIADEFSDVSYLLDQLANRRVDRFCIRERLMELVNCSAVDVDTPVVTYEATSVPVEEDDEDAERTE